METLILKSNSKKDISIIKEIALKFGMKIENIKTHSTKEIKFYKDFEKAIKEAKDIQSGKTKGQSLKSFLDEL